MKTSEAVNPYVHSSSGQIVKNSTDLCWRTGFWTPALAEAMGVDGAGCACDADILDKQACTAVEAPVATKSAEKVTFSADTLFNFDRATLKPEGQAVLDDLVSQRRADAVKAYLVQKGVDAALIKTEGKGSADPVVNCPNPSKAGQIKNFRALVDCLQPNRRAVVEVVGSRPAM